MLRDLFLPLRSRWFWAGLIPVLIFKAWMICQLSTPLFHPDSHTFYRTVEILWTRGEISIHPKRSYLYPLLLSLLHGLPGPMGLLILVVQHLASLLVPLAFVATVRLHTRALPALDGLAAALLGLSAPLLYYSHDIMADAPYAVAFWIFLFALAHFAKNPLPSSATAMLWTAFLALSFRPDGKLAVLVALASVAWHGRSLLSRTPALRIARACALPLLACAGLWAGTKVTQQGWLFYSSVMPLTQLDTPLLSDYKAELRPVVEKARQNLPHYPGQIADVMGMLSRKSDASPGPLWDKLKSRGQSRELHAVCSQLAREAALSDPLGVLRLTFYKVRRVMSEGRGLWGNFLPTEILYDWGKQFEEHPFYAESLCGNTQAWEQSRSSLASQSGATLLMRIFRALEWWSAPVWWSPFTLCSLLGWTIWCWRHPSTLWLPAAAAGKILATYLIARGILRYLLPLEPLLWGGILCGIWACSEFISDRKEKKA